MAKSIVKSLPQVVQEAFKRLEPRQRRFVIAYCTTHPGNQTGAAKAAGYSPRSATSVSHVLMQNEDIRAAIDAWNTEFGMTSAETTMRIADLCRVSMAPFTTFDETEKKLKLSINKKEVWEQYAHWVRAVDINEKGEIIKLHLHNSQQALATMAKMQKLFSDAPQFAVFMLFQQLSDEELLRQVEEERKRLKSTSYLGRGS